MVIKETRINRISIQNYKGISKLEIRFPSPHMANEPDVAIFGSKNGAGKTSILECCALIITAANGQLESRIDELGVDIVRSGAEQAEISADVILRGKSGEVKVIITPDNKISYDYLIKTREDFLYKNDKVPLILGFSPEPYRCNNLFYVHGYRKVVEGSMDLGAILKNDLRDNNDRLYRPRLIGRRADRLSLFKQIVMRWQLNQANLLEKPFQKSKGDEDESLSILKKLLLKYANVKLNKFRPYEDSSFSLLVESNDDPAIVFPIDGLSSGQKEIISSLFMIWEITHKAPSVVLIDEPELHMNTEWHKSYVRDLVNLAPNNQYIIATHSEYVMDSVNGFHFMIRISK